MFYIVNLTQKRIQGEYEDRSRANYVLTDAYSPDPVDKYMVMSLEELEDWQKGLK